MAARSNHTDTAILASDHYDGAAWAWTAFWREQPADSRCLAGASPEVRTALDKHWIDLADSLPASSSILDIGCGAGIVGRNLLRGRGDLLVTGVDLADIPPSADERLPRLSRTAMENLPFGNERFDAAVSQFGFEYGSVVRAAKEIARVLKPGAPFSFLVHHAHSPIIREDRERGRALDFILGAAVELAFLSGLRGDLNRLLQLVRSSSPCDFIVDQLANALRARVALSPKERQATWNAIVDALEPERELISALETSCIAPDGLDEWLEKLSLSLEISGAAALCLPNGEAIAWKIEGARSIAAEDNCASRSPLSAVADANELPDAVVSYSPGDRC